MIVSEDCTIDVWLVLALALVNVISYENKCGSKLWCHLWSSFTIIIYNCNILYKKYFEDCKWSLYYQCFIKTYLISAAPNWDIIYKCNIFIKQTTDLQCQFSSLNQFFCEKNPPPVWGNPLLNYLTNFGH